MTLNEHSIRDLVTKCLNWNPKTAGIGAFDYIDLSSVDKDTKSIASTERYDCSDAPSRARQLVETDDVLVATVRPNLNGVARVSSAHHGMTASTGYCVLRPRRKKLDSGYLFQWVKTEAFVQRMVDVASGANYPAVSDAKVKESKIPLPPLAEQKRIARILDEADALRAKRRESLAQLGTLLQSTFLDMFGDPVANPKGWERRPLGELIDNEDGKRRPVKKSDRERMSGDVPYYGASGIIDYVDRYLFEGERLLVGEDGANLAVRSTPVAFIARGRYWVNNHAHVLAFSGKTALTFLEVTINSMDLKPYLSGTAQPKLNQKNLDRIPIPTPPFDLQRNFASIVESVQKQKSAQRAHLAELDALFASLQSRAFRGEL